MHEFIDEILSRIPSWIILSICTLLIRSWINKLGENVTKLFNRVDYNSDQTESIHAGLSKALNGKYAEGYKEEYERTMEQKEHLRNRLEQNTDGNKNKIFF